MLRVAVSKLGKGSQINKMLTKSGILGLTKPKLFVNATLLMMRYNKPLLDIPPVPSVSQLAKYSVYDDDKPTGVLPRGVIGVGTTSTDGTKKATGSVSMATKSAPLAASQQKLAVSRAIDEEDAPTIRLAKTDKHEAKEMKPESKSAEFGETKCEGPPSPSSPPQSQSQSKEHSYESKIKKRDPEINFPSKEQVEKYFFRVVAFIYDVTFLTANWTVKAIDQHIIKNEMVQMYWKKFHEKMQQAKKD